MEDGEAIPAPPRLCEIMDNPDHHDAVAVLIDASVRRPPVRVNVSVRSDLLDAIDRVSDNRSRFLADAARARLQENSGGVEGKASVCVLTGPG